MNNELEIVPIQKNDVMKPVKSNDNVFKEILDKYKVNSTDRIFILLRAKNPIATYDDISDMIKNDELFGKTSRQYNEDYIKVRLCQDHNKQALNEILLITLNDLYKVEDSKIGYLLNRIIIGYLEKCMANNENVDMTEVRKMWDTFKKSESIKKTQTMIIKKDLDKKDFSQWE